MLELILAFAPIVVIAHGLLATPWGLPALSWLIGNPVVRVVAVIGIAIAAVWIAYQIGRKSGVDRIKAQQAKRNLEALQERIQVDETIAKMPPSKRREELSKWVR
ncbi:hypothetical protein [Devosia submarina]|uniref:hypothetical protein n=1 Tax=Devosia submarina TaxID=1173082 RepID=UPI000D3578F7|nr:hypothetical protein [Devosia submarina]